MFTQAMMTNIDELANERHLTMSFLEFLEGLSRIADKFSLDNLPNLFPDSHSHHPTKLDKKLESICLKLIQMTMPDKKYKELLHKYTELKHIEVESPGRMKFKKI